MRTKMYIMSAEDIKEFVMKGACAAKDAEDARRFKISQILEGVKYESEKEQEQMLNSFLTSVMPLNEIENYAKWRMERDAAPLTKKEHAGVQ